MDKAIRQNTIDSKNTKKDKTPKWIYKKTMDNKNRYVLGIEGKNPLICIGVNPSTAEPNNLDRTMKSVEKFSKKMGYDSYIMLNLYPQRATNPDELDKDINKKIVKENLKHIEKIFEKKNLTIWSAWGTLINKRKYLKNCLEDIVLIAEKYDCKWISIGPLSKNGSHPHHPLYLSDKSDYKDFDIKKYLCNL